MKGSIAIFVVLMLSSPGVAPVKGSEPRPSPDTPPYLDNSDGIAPSNVQVTVGIHKATIRLRGTSGSGTTMAFVQIDIEGKGDPEQYVKPQQTLLIIDDSGSMEENDPTNLRLDAARSYIDILQRYNLGDEVGVIRFSNDASLLHGLSRDYESVKASLSQFYSTGSTNMRDALNVANNELSPRKKDGYTWNYILLTDGCWNIGGNPQPEVDRASSMQVRVFTIGLGEDTGNCATGLDSTDLKAWSLQTNGVYYPAPEASNLTPIFKQIAKDIRDVAGYAPTGKPMLRVKLTEDIEVVKGSFNIAPTRPKDIPIGNKGLTLEWDKPVTRLKIGDVLSVKFLIQSYREGKDIPVLDTNLSLMQYTRTDGVDGSDPVDQLYVDVFKPVSPGGGGDGGGNTGIIPGVPISQENLTLGMITLFPFAIVVALIFLIFLRRRRRLEIELQRTKEKEKKKKKPHPVKEDIPKPI